MNSCRWFAACIPQVIELFPLAIFPEGALSSSVITTVWVGIFVVAFFNLRLGWVLSGLVVPGYLVPLILIKPTAAAVVLGEGVITYFIVWFYSEFLSARFGWSNFFGRDRFFALVLVSVGVRIISDGWLLPLFGEYLNNTWQLQFDYRNNLHSFGLIIIALIANNFWKTGFFRGLIPLFTTIALTTLIVRWGLMEATNFSISSVAYLYEDMASSILASPKAYIILLTTAFVASRMNLFYGWDFSGILIPSLLALQWYQPQKIFMSFAEALIILVLAQLALSLGVFQRMTMEGARKVLLFFNIGFLWKIVLAYALIAYAPEIKITDYYGFGYLLPTLIAMKMHDKDIVARMSRAVLQTSLVSVLIATLVGFSLSLLPDPWHWLAARSEGKQTIRPVDATGSIIAQLREDKVAQYRTRVKEVVAKPLMREEESFAVALTHLADVKRFDAPEIDEAAQFLDQANYRIERREGRFLMLREKEPRKHWGTYIINPQAHNNLIIEVPAPLEERGALEAAAWLFRSLNARALVVAGAARRANKDGSSDVLVYPNTLYQNFHRTFARRNVLQVRAYTTETARLVGGMRRPSESLVLEEPNSTLRVKGQLPDDFSLSRFKELAGTFDLSWDALPDNNLQRNTTANGFVEIILNRDDMRRVLARSLAAEHGARLENLDRSLDGHLQAWLLADKTRIAAAGTNLYRTPQPEDLIYLDDEIITPMFAAAKRYYQSGQWTPEGLDELRLINLAASSIGYELVRYRHQGSGSDYLLLAERNDAHPRRYWGTFVLRLGKSEQYVIEVPRPIFEVNSFEFGVALYEHLQARMLLIGGAHPEANQNHSADLVRLSNKANVFNLVAQALLRESGEIPMSVIQTRALGQRPDSVLPDVDLLLSFANGLQNPAAASPLGKQLFNVLKQSGYTHGFAGGSLEAAGYEASGLVPAFYQNASQNKEFVVAWLSPLARNSLRQQTDPTTPQSHQFAALHIPTHEADLAKTLAALPASPERLTDTLRGHLDAYISRQDIVILASVRQSAPTLHFERIVDMNSRQGYLLILDEQKRWLAVANLSARNPALIQSAERGEIALQVSHFIRQNNAWFLGVREP